MAKTYTKLANGDVVEKNVNNRTITLAIINSEIDACNRRIAAEQARKQAWQDLKNMPVT